jgi:hypothetical protein
MKTLLIVLGLAVAAGGGYWFITKNKSPKPVPGQLPPAPPNKPLAGNLAEQFGLFDGDEEL